MSAEERLKKALTVMASMWTTLNTVASSLEESKSSSRRAQMIRDFQRSIAPDYEQAMGDLPADQKPTPPGGG